MGGTCGPAPFFEIIGVIIILPFVNLNANLRYLIKDRFKIVFKIMFNPGFLLK